MDTTYPPTYWQKLSLFCVISLFPKEQPGRQHSCITAANLFSAFSWLQSDRSRTSFQDNLGQSALISNPLGEVPLGLDFVTRSWCASNPKLTNGSMHSCQFLIETIQVNVYGFYCFRAKIQTHWELSDSVEDKIVSFHCKGSSATVNIQMLVSVDQISLQYRSLLCLAF